MTLALEHHDVIIALARELPRGGEPRDTGARDDDLQSQPRWAAAERTTSATAATNPGSSFRDAVRSS